MESVIKSPDAEVFWEAIGKKGRHMYIRTSEEDSKYEDYQWQDMPKAVRQSISRQMNMHYRKPSLSAGSWRGAETNKIEQYGSEQTAGVIGEEGKKVPTVRRLRPERENGTKPNVKQVHLEDKEKIVPLLAARVVAGAAARKLIDDDDEEKAFVSKPDLHTGAHTRVHDALEREGEGKGDKWALANWIVHGQGGRARKLEQDAPKSKEFLKAVINEIQKHGGAMPEQILKDIGICSCSLEGIIIDNKAIVKYDNAITFIVQNARDNSSMTTINKYNPASSSYYEDPNIIKIGDRVIFAGGEGEIITVTGNYVTILKDDKTKDMVHIRSVIRKTDIIYTAKSGLTCWNGIGTGEKQIILQKAGIPLSFISKDWVDIPMNVKNVIQARFGQPVAKEEHEKDKDEYPEFDTPANVKRGTKKEYKKEEDEEPWKPQEAKDKEKKKQTLETSNIGVDVPPKDATPKQEQAYNEARTLFFEIKDTWGGSADLGRFVRDHRESERKYNKDWLQNLERKINNAIKLGMLHHKLGVLSIVDTRKSDSKKKQSINKDGVDGWPNYGDAGDAGNRDNATQQGAGQDYSSNVKKPKKKQIRNDDKERKDRQTGDNSKIQKAEHYCQDCGFETDVESTYKRHFLSDKHKKATKKDANVTTETSGTSNPVYGGEKKPKKVNKQISKYECPTCGKKDMTYAEADKHRATNRGHNPIKKGVGGVLREVAVASAAEGGFGALRESRGGSKPKKPKTGQATGTKPASTKPSPTSRQPLKRWNVGVPDSVSINGIRPFIIKEEINIDDISSEYYRPIEQDYNFVKPKRSDKPDKPPKTDKPPQMMKPQSYAGAYRA